jgi:DNA repair exonuclease SbcCD nuclease subunit
MIIGQLGDLHLTNKRPVRRLDDYFQTQLTKLEFGLTALKNKGCTTFIQVGDFFDTPFVANKVESAVISLLNKLDIRIYCVFGQHDISGHSISTLPNSPLTVLQAANVVKIVGVEDVIDLGENHFLYGSPFGQEIPAVKEKTAYNILITHRMIGDKPLWPGQILESPKKFLVENLDFNLVCIGDYHYRFDQAYKNQLMVNTGAMLRHTIGVRDLSLIPSFGIIDSKTNQITYLNLPHQPKEMVFDLHKEENNDKDVILSLIQKLQEQEEQEVHWKEILKLVIKERNASESVKTCIDKILEEVNVRK